MLNGTHITLSMRRRTSLEIRFLTNRLKRLYADQKGTHKYPPAVVDAFFEVMDMIVAAPDERDLYDLKSLRFEKLGGDRQHQRSLRLNDQFRLIVELPDDEQGRLMLIVNIEDYHRTASVTRQGGGG